MNLTCIPFEAKLLKKAEELIDIPREIIAKLEALGPVPIERGSGPRFSKYDSRAIEEWVKKLRKAFPGSKVLGHGSSRRAISINDDLTLKVARGSAGVAQNRLEYSVYRMVKDCAMTTRIFYYHEKFHWLLSERVVRMARNSDFKIYGTNGPRALLIWAYNEDDWDMLNPKFEHDYKTLQKILDHLGGKRMIGEHSDLGQWGIVRRQGQEYPVLLDTGFSKEVARRYY
jgi:hypothetical protein